MVAAPLLFFSIFLIVVKKGVILIKEEFTYQEMEELINKGEGKVIKRSRKRNDRGMARAWIRYNENEFLLCSKCDNYLKLNEFCDVNKKTLANKDFTCKRCTSRISKNSYCNNYITHLRQRYKSLVKNSNKCSVPYLTFDEFIEFAKIEKDPIYKYTLEKAFNEEKYGMFEIEHKFPISEGGTSLKNNLTLSCKAFNRLKGTMSAEDAIEIAKMIVKNEEDIKKVYK